MKAYLLILFYTLNLNLFLKFRLTFLCFFEKLNFHFSHQLAYTNHI